MITNLNRTMLVAIMTLIALVATTSMASADGSQIGNIKVLEHHWDCYRGYNQDGLYINWQCWVNDPAPPHQQVTTGWWWQGTDASYPAVAIDYYDGNNFLLGYNWADVPSGYGAVYPCASPSPWSSHYTC